jgi:hypothetical protein
MKLNKKSMKFTEYAGLLRRRYNNTNANSDFKKRKAHLDRLFQVEFLGHEEPGDEGCSLVLGRSGENVGEQTTFHELHHLRTDTLLLLQVILLEDKLCIISSFDNI